MSVCTGQHHLPQMPMLSRTPNFPAVGHVAPGYYLLLLKSGDILVLVSVSMGRLSHYVYWLKTSMGMGYLQAKSLASLRHLEAVWFIRQYPKVPPIILYLLLPGRNGVVLKVAEDEMLT